MKEKKRSAGSWILEWAGQKRSAYVWSVVLAVLNVVFKIIPYFIIADVVGLFLDGNKDFTEYMVKAVWIALSFIIAELFHSLSTALSHKATFTVLANIRKACCEKLARVPLGYVKDTSSGTFKNILVERIDSIETTLAHIVPEFTSNLLAPVIILIYFFMTDWRLALWSLVPVVVGLLSYFGMMIDYKPSFERTVKTTKDLNDAAVEYIDGIEVIKAFGKTESSYAKFTKAAMAYADSFISWMKRCSIYHALMMVVTPYTLLTVLPFGAHYVENGTLTISDFVMCIILSLGIVGPLITVGSYTDDLGKIGVIVDEVVGILEQPELKRPKKSAAVPKDNSITLTDVRFGYHEKEILHGVNMKLEAGTVNAIVGGAGGYLSGGERQRISIARAMLKDAPIVILDEATAYTDPENESILQNSIAKLVAGKTLIVIAHRLSTVKDSDQIFVVNDGNVATHGTHDELLAACRLYNEMWNAHISVKDTAKEGE